MGGVATTAKYVVHAVIEIDGLVDKPDVIGAIFGQTEGLLGSDLDLRELQKCGRIGRILVELNNRNGRTFGKIMIPSSLDRIETALIAAAIETVDKVGPYNARVRVERIEDLRVKKRKWIIERAKELLLRWEQEEIPESRKLVEEVMKGLKAAEIIKYGPEGLPAGPEVGKSNTIIIVEGRADVLNLIRHGYRNVIALGGATKVPRTIIDLAKHKTAIAFVDGDRGGELVLRELLQATDIDYIARAPPGKEVEELTAKEIAKCLKNKISVRDYLETLERLKAQIVKPEKLILHIPDDVLNIIRDLRGTLEAIIFDENWNIIERVPVRDLVNTIQKIEKASSVIFDGIITQRLVDIASSKGIKYLIGVRIGALARVPEGIVTLTFNEVMKRIRTI